MLLRSAACVVVLHPDGRLLAVSRRNAPLLRGLPGGKVDPGESNFEAAVRECSEEVGFKFQPSQLEPIYSALCPGRGPADSFWVTTYLYQGPTPPIERLTAEAGLVVCWEPREVLCDPARSPFASYNEAVLCALAQYSTGLLHATFRAE